MNTFHLHVFRYIFEEKETKQIESKGRKTKDANAESGPKGKVIARLQVGVSQFNFSSFVFLFIHFDLFGSGLTTLLEVFFVLCCGPLL